MAERAEWHHVPEVPIKVSPLWQWPPRPLAALRWYAQGWFFVTLNMGILGLAWLSYLLASPTLAQAQVLAPGWVLLVLLRNLVIVTALAGGLHWWFHARRGQGDRMKYDPRPFPRRGRAFSFDDQLWDNVFWTLCSGVPIWSALEVLFWWLLANGIVPATTFAQAPIWFVAFFFLIPVWESFYFYWIHRLLHTRPFYRFHALHHRNTDVGPWSGLSMHPVEHLLYFGTVVIHLVLPTHPVHLIFHLMFYGLLAITSHTGFEGLWLRQAKRLHLGNFHHQLHHRYFEVNYGNLDVPWDKLFGSFHDGTEAGKAMMRARLKGRRR
ncbi:MAG: sterol desaturase family protein [Sulfitobacter sp.]|nr:sterol desaturase family protein [Sulfitobacter sp.]